jgi:Bacterial regulatory proteins, luxR family
MLSDASTVTGDFAQPPLPAFGGQVRCRSIYDAAAMEDPAGTAGALMAEGLQDDAIARRAGISTSTVRRHITAIMTRPGVASRFAAGAAAQRRGWIG